LAREQFQTLSEPMYYILLSLTEECCGVDIMKRVAELSKNRIAVGPGTLYTLLAKFDETHVISQTNFQGRKKAYIISDYGKKLLMSEYERLIMMSIDGKKIMEGWR
jgi:DNA-binding PadR family transcriptional regulator